MEKYRKSRSGHYGLTSVEAEGKTSAEAIGKALNILGASRSEVAIRVLSEEERGLFGMPGARPAKIKATLLKKKDKGTAKS